MNIDTEHIHKMESDYQITGHTSYQQFTRDLYYDLDNEDNSKIVLQRNLKDDTFNSTLTYNSDVHIRGEFDFTTQINDDDAISVFHDSNYNLVNWSYLNGEKMRLHHSQIKDKKFKDLNHTYYIISARFYEHLMYSNWTGMKPIYNSMLEIGNKSSVNSQSINFEDAIELTSLNSIILDTNLEKTYDHSYSNQEQWSEVLPITKSYNHVLLVPAKYSRRGNNKTLFEVYSMNDDETSLVGDLDFKNGYMTTSATGKSRYDVNFVGIDNPSITKINDKNYYKVGEYEIATESYYDYKLGKTVVGTGPGASQGEIIPFNITDYSRQLHFSFNRDFEDLEINQSVKFDNPLMDPINGLIILREEDEDIMDEAENKFNMFSLSWDKLSPILDEVNNKDMNFTFKTLIRDEINVS